MGKYHFRVRLEKDDPGWFAELEELSLHSNGRTKRQTLTKLAQLVLDYWFHLQEDESLRYTEPCKKHYQFYVHRLWPSVLATLQRPVEPLETPLLPLIAYKSASSWLRGAGSPVKSAAP